MKVRINNKWVDVVDYDAHDKVVIKVTKWLCLGAAPRAYFSYPFSPEILWHYRSIGLKSIARKIISRTKNHKVSQKYISIGKGVVEKSFGQFKAGDSVVFIATNHPEGLTRIVLDEFWIRPTKTKTSGSPQWAIHKTDFLNYIGGYELESGSPLPEISFTEVESCLSDTVFSEYITDASPFASSSIAKNNRRRKKINKVTIFGWGHHARTQIAPNLPATHTLTRVHDIDPMVLKLTNENITVDSGRRIAKDDDSDVVIVAGYHHTHTDLVLEALDLGKAVICEKPLATSWKQFAQLETLIAPRLTMAYHRRYDAFFDLIREDLSPEHSKIDYRCIVHEVSLPKNHWYNWPVSKSKIVSNGCHWIDHFLALKPGLKIVELGAFKNAQGIHCNLELEDCSVFEMLLSDKGSDAKGNREEIHIQSGDCSVFIKNFESYIFSKAGKNIRTEHAKKLEVFPRMYEFIFKYIEDEKFDDFSEALRTQRTILELDDALELYREKNN